MIRRKSYRGAQKGFTLIELLIVVAIIALLVSILMPALRAAKERSKRLLCTSQLHQLGVVFMQYAGDFGDYFPVFHYNDKGYMYYYVTDDFMMWLGDGYAREQYPQLGPGHYGLPHKVFYCPAIMPNKWFGDMVTDWWWFRPNNDGSNSKMPGRDLQPDVKPDGSPRYGCQYPGGAYDCINMGYALYVPRNERCGPGPQHPFGGSTGAGWKLHPGRDYLAPDRPSGRTAPFNPIISDVIQVRWNSNANWYPGITSLPTIYAYFTSRDIKALTGLVSRYKFGRALEERSTHQSNTGLITQSNSLYADGRVIENPGETVVPYYQGDFATFW